VFSLPFTFCTPPPFPLRSPLSVNHLNASRAGVRITLRLLVPYTIRLPVLCRMMLALRHISPPFLLLSNPGIEPPDVISCRVPPRIVSPQTSTNHFVSFPLDLVTQLPCSLQTPVSSQLHLSTSLFPTLSLNASTADDPWKPYRCFLMVFPPPPLQSPRPPFTTIGCLNTIPCNSSGSPPRPFCVHPPSPRRAGRQINNIYVWFLFLSCTPCPPPNRRRALQSHMSARISPPFFSFYT